MRPCGRCASVWRGRRHPATTLTRWCTRGIIPEQSVDTAGAGAGLNWCATHDEGQGEGWPIAGETESQTGRYVMTGAAGCKWFCRPAALALATAITMSFGLLAQEPEKDQQPAAAQEN